MKATQAALLERVMQAPSGCWIWRQRVDRDGYGLVNLTLDGRRVTRGAHRLAFELFVGVIPSGYQVDHLCRRVRCVNPDHLQAVSPMVNAHRSSSFAAMGARRERCLYGHPLDGRRRGRGKRADRLDRYCRTCDRARRLVA